MYVQVALNIPAHKLFTYEVPELMRAKAEIGRRVYVPFGNTKRTGFIVGLSPASDLAHIKPITSVLDDEALFDLKDLEFFSWISDYFIYPLGKTLAELIPSGAEKKDFRWVMPRALQGKVSPSPAQKKLLEIVGAHPRGLALRDLIKKSDLKNAATVARSLQLAGMIDIVHKEKAHLAIRTQKMIGLDASAVDSLKLTSRQQAVVDYLKTTGVIELHDLMSATRTTRAIINKLIEKDIVTVNDAEVIRKASLTTSIRPPAGHIVLNDEQASAHETLKRFLERGVFQPVLLHGVTGSGKTEVYLSAIDQVLKQGGRAMYLVPEIALTPQLLSRIAGRFDDQAIAIIHSGITETVRYDQWREIRRGHIRLVIGARSAIFAPLPDLKLIIVDEEHDTSYKQDDRLCYNARDLAVMKAKLSNAVIVLGSATPGLRTAYNARTNKYACLALTKRAQNTPLPKIDIIDMKVQKETHGQAPILSAPLVTALKDTLARREQALLFLNKRGFDTFLICGDCGYSFTCPHCAVSLKSHPAENLVKCHYCDYSSKAQPLCPTCRGSRILNYGAGTQKLEAQLQSLFPEARIVRMDSDTTAGRGSQEKILASLEQKKIDILVGTQMITKGHDFPGITLVGVISADTSLNLPDFRAAEKTFQTLTQVAGRGGRGSASGRVIIQTFNPLHYALKHARRHDYEAFYSEEIEHRRALLYPPFGRIINIKLSSARQDVLVSTAVELGRRALELAGRYGGDIQIIGPSEAPLSKIRGQYRRQMLIKGTNGKNLHAIAAKLQESHDTAPVKMTVDVDPENFM